MDLIGWTNPIREKMLGEGNLCNSIQQIIESCHEIENYEIESFTVQ
tara:strand:+ start:248 stop:385 length:138 start_codon:yes stop_codon:yes gene_type:complete